MAVDSPSAAIRMRETLLRDITNAGYNAPTLSVEIRGRRKEVSTPYSPVLRRRSYSEAQVWRRKLDIAHTASTFCQTGDTLPS